MQVNPMFLIGLACAVFTLAACQKPSNKTDTSISILSNVQPTQLFIGRKVGDSAERCVYAVLVRNALQACQQHNCDIQAFYWPIQVLNDSQRALLVAECSTNQKLGTGHLLSNKGPTDDSGILIFQQQREGQGLWQNIELPNGDYGVQLTTEAAEGVLTYQQGSYSWEENPDYPNTRQAP